MGMGALRRWVPLLLAGALVAAGAAGCGKDSGAPQPGGSPGASGSAGAAAGGGAFGAGSAPASAGTGGAASSGTQTSFPKDAKAYAQATLTAYLDRQDTRLAQLAGSGAVHSLAEIPGPADRHWHYHACSGPQTITCTFFNNDGDELTMDLDATSLGRAHAVQQAAYQQTEYPTAANLYVSAYLQAWVDGNTYRMAKLATAAVTAALAKTKKPSGWSYADDGTAGHTHVRVTDSYGFDRTFDVTNQLLGSTHAITALCDPTCP
jgi:hypothetical protein